MQIQGAGRGRRDSEPRKRGETPYKNYWGPFPARTTKAPESAAACGGSERGGLLGGAGRPLCRRGAASAPAGSRRAAQAAALQVGHLPLSCSTTWLRGAFSPPTPHLIYLFIYFNLISRCFPRFPAKRDGHRGAELGRRVHAAADRWLFLLFCQARREKGPEGPAGSRSRAWIQPGEAAAAHHGRR